MQNPKISWSPLSPELVHDAQSALAQGSAANAGVVLELVMQCEKKTTPFILGKMRTRRIARETGLHEDVTREVVLVLLKSALLAYRVENDASFDTYLLRIAERIFARMLSKAERVARLSPDQDDTERLVSCLESRHVAEDEHLTRLQLAAALDKLSPKERDALLHYVFYGHTYQELADRWELPLSTAYRYIKAVLAKLRRELTESEPQNRKQYTK